MSKKSNWCRSLYDKMRDGGIWGVPRAGLVFRKQASDKTLLLVAVMPPTPRLSEWVRVPGMSPQQLHDHVRLVEMETLIPEFEKAGITVAAIAPLKEYADMDEATADQSTILRYNIPGRQ